MLPVLFQLDTSSTVSSTVLAVLFVGLVSFAGWFGWREHPGERVRAFRAALYASVVLFASALVLLRVVPPLGPGAASWVAPVLWLLGLALVAAAGTFGWQVKRNAGDAIAYVLVAAFVAYVGVRFGVKGPMGGGKGLSLPSYGALVVTGFVLAVVISGQRALREFAGETVTVGGKQVPAGPVMRKHTWELGGWGVLSALLGARVLHVITLWPAYRRDPSQLFAFDGGLVFYGGVIGVAIAFFTYALWHKLPLRRFADLAAPTFALGHMLGRTGCFLAGCCWGRYAPEGSAIAVRFPSAANVSGPAFDSAAYLEQLQDSRFVDALGHVHDVAVAGAQRIDLTVASSGFSLPVYPVQLMEAGAELALFGFLLWMTGRRRFHGQLGALWLVCYSIIRATTEYFRGDTSRGFLFRLPAEDPFILSTSQTISVGILALGVALYVLWARGSRADASPQPKPA